MLKKVLRKWLQRILGYETYLFVLGCARIYCIRLFGWEKAFRDFSAMTSDEGILLDIGANIGITTVILSRMHPHAQVHAVEPVPSNVRVMKKVLQWFHVKNVCIHETALGNKTGTANMQVPSVYGAQMHGLAHIVQGDPYDPATGHTVQVPLQTMDDLFLPGMNKKITGIKLDVENAELAVLQGAAKTFAQNEPLVFCEIWNDAKKEATIFLMKQRGYAIKVWQGDQYVDYTGQDSLNYLMVPANDNKQS